AESMRQLDSEDAEIQQRTGVKELLIQDLIAGHSSLAEITSQFLALNQGRPEYMWVIRTNFAGTTDEEKMARNVIQYAVTRTADPTQKDRLARQLQADLRAMMHNHEPPTE